MVSIATPDSGAIVPGDRGTDDSLDSGPVEGWPGATATWTGWRDARAERLRRRVLEVRVAALEAALERERRRRAEVVSHYEQVLSTRDGVDSPVFSWTARP